MEDCCQPKNNYKKSFWSGLLYGLVPHTFCIIFLILSVLGAAGATTLFGKFLLIPHFFLFLVVASFLFATLSAVVYLRKMDCRTVSKIKNKWKYLSVLYLTTIATNVIIMFVFFPMTANSQSKYAGLQSPSQQTINLEVDIPCPGHASLIISEIKKDVGVINVKYQLPSTFEVVFDPQKTSVEKISGLEIFKTFKIKVEN